MTSTSFATEFDILKASHKFLREDENPEARNSSWNDQLAQKYYDSLFREFAVCDLKHYKSGNVMIVSDSSSHFADFCPSSPFAGAPSQKYCLGQERTAAGIHGANTTILGIRPRS